MPEQTLTYEEWKSAFPALYTSLFEIPWKMIDQTDGITAFNGPFLSFPKPGFLEQEKRLLIFGQETYGWCGSGYQERTTEMVIETAFNCYNEFFYRDHDCPNRKHDKKENRDLYPQCHAFHYPSPFWRAFRKTAGFDYRDAVWCNLMPFDCYDANNKVPPSLITHHDGTAESKYTKFLAEKVVPVYLKHLNPTHILFFTGPKFDTLILDVIKGSRFAMELPDGLSLKVGLSKGAAPSETLRLVEDIPGFQGKALRTYHPNFMSFHGWQDYLTTLKQFASVIQV
jgi:hypothetical protein